MTEGTGRKFPPTLAAGQRDIQDLRDGGADDATISTFVQETNSTLIEGGATPSALREYWGDGPAHSPELQRYFEGNIRTAIAKDPKVADNPVEAFWAGLQMSATGLGVRMATGQGRPKDQLSADAKLPEIVANAVGQTVGDLPLSIAGLLGGGAAGAVGGTAVAAVPGGLIGGIAGAGAGAAFAPEATRQALLAGFDAQEGKIRNWQDAATVAARAGKEVAITTGVGLVTAPLGAGAGSVAKRVGANVVTATGVDAVTQAVTATGFFAALEGRGLSEQDINAAIITALGFHGAAFVAARAGRGRPGQARVRSNVETTVVRTGLTPRQLAAMAERDPEVARELRNQDVNGEPVTPKLRNMAPREPQPWDQTQPQAAPLAAGATASPKLTANSPAAASALLEKLEGSEAHGKRYGIPTAMVVSPAGAIGRYQIMPGTARQYMGKDFDVRKLFDEGVNKEVHNRIVADLFKRYNGDMSAIAIAYNAGPGRATQWLKQGPGTRLKATPDAAVKGGMRYEYEPAARNEKFLPLETQKYLANGRRRLGGEMPGSGDVTRMPRPENEPAAGTAPKADEPSPKPAAKPGEPEPNPWDGASEADLVKGVYDQIGEQPPLKRDNVGEFVSGFITELFPAMKIDAFLAKSDSYDRRTQIGAEDMSRQTYASDSRTYSFVMQHPLKGDTLEVRTDQPALRDAFDAAKADGGNYDGFVAWMTTSRAADLEARGIKSGFDPKLLKTFTADTDRAKKYGRATNLFNKTMDAGLEYGVDSGLFTRDLVDAMKRDNPVYVKFRRISGNTEAPILARSFKTKQPLKQIKGGEEKILDPIESTIDNLRAIVAASDRNKALAHYVELMETGKLTDISKVEDVDLATYGKSLEDAGLPNTPETRKTYAWLLAEQARKGAKEDEFIFFRDGKAERYRATSPELAALLRTTQTKGQADIVTNIFQKAGKVTRATITAMLDFPIRIFGIDQFASFILDPHHPVPFLTPLVGAAHMLKQDAVFQAARANGALANTMITMDRNWVTKNIADAFEDTNTFKRAANLVPNPLTLAQIVSERLTMANQVGYFDLVQKRGKGISPLKAGSLARTAYLDFAERGTNAVTQWMAGVTPFYRAGTLGVKQVLEAFGARPAQTTAYAAAAISAPMLALYALNVMQDEALDADDPQRWDQIPRWQKDHYFITPVIGGQRYRLRLPPGIGFAFGGMVNRMMDLAMGKDPKATKDMLQSFLVDFLPPMGVPAVQTPLELVANHSFFTGESIVPASLEGADGYMQYTPATSELGKSLARFMGEPGIDVADFSPAQFDYAVKNFLGPAGDMFLQALDLPYADRKRPKDIADVPFVKSFIARNPQLGAQSIELFFDESSELQKKSKNFSLAKMRALYGMDPEMAEMVATMSQSKEAAMIQPVREMLTMKTRIIHGINANPDLTADEKRQLTDKEVTEAIGISKYGLEVIAQIKELRKLGVPLRGAVPDEDDVEAGDSAEPAYDDEDEAPAEPLPGANAGQMPLS